MQGPHNHSLDGTGPGIKLPFFTFTLMTNIKYMEQDVKKNRDLALVTKRGKNGINKNNIALSLIRWGKQVIVTYYTHTLSSLFSEDLREPSQ